MQSTDHDLEIVKKYYTNIEHLKNEERFNNIPENYKEIKTLHDLLRINYRYQPTKLQLRENLINKIKKEQNPFVGIIGFDETVIPAVKRAILAGHDILLIGHIGQGKTKLAELLSENLLSPIPIVEGTNTNDIPTEMPLSNLLNLLEDKEISRSIPEFFVSKDCEEIIRNNKLNTRIKWINGKSRYRYVLATPDISVKDLVGQIDVVKAIKKGVEVFDIDSYSPGYLLQSRYGILCLDELPVLDPRKQVTLLSVLQEGRFTTGAYPIFFKPDVKIIATANPIDYTHSGKIIEPLADRLKSHIETHYPLTLDDEILIAIQESDMLGRKNTFLPIFILKSIAKIFQSLRNNPEINNERGVSVRSTIHSLETIIGEVERIRGIIQGSITIPRFSDIFCITQSSKFELDEIEDTTENRSKFLHGIINQTIKEVAIEYLEGYKYSGNENSTIENEKIINSQDIISIKNEFKGKSFTVLQNQYLGQNEARNDRNKHHLYSEQLRKFPTTKKIVYRIIKKINTEQQEYINKAQRSHLFNNLEYIIYKNSKIQNLNNEDEKEEEMIATAAELFLEYLRFCNPPILDRKAEDYIGK